LRVKWCCMPVIPALRRLRQEDGEFKTSLGYTAKLCLKKLRTVLFKILRNMSGTVYTFLFLFYSTISIILVESL
jgi:hypothetical protein